MAVIALILIFSGDSETVTGALIRVGIITLVAGTVTYLSILRVRATEELKASEDKFRSLFENALIGLFRVDKDGRFLEMNWAYARIYGYESPKEMMEVVSTIADLCYSDQEKEEISSLITATVDIRRHEMLNLHKDGYTIWVSLNARMITDDNGIVVGVEGTIEDITEKKAYRLELEKKNEDIHAAYEELAGQEEELKHQVEELFTAHEDIAASERRFRLLFEHSSIGIALREIICDDSGKPVDHRFLDVNPAYELQTGLSAKEIIGRTVREILPGTEDIWIDTYGQVALDGTPRVISSYYQELNKYYQVIAYSPERGQFATLITDITENILRENELKETNAYLENLIAYANVPIIVWDTSLQITRVNHSFELLVEQSSDALVGKPLEILFPPDQIERSMHLIRSTHDGVRWETVEMSLLCHSGGIKKVLWNSSTIYDADGQSPVATIAQGRDVTAEKILEEEKIAATRQIQENIAKLAVLNDGIRNPLMIIAMYAEMSENREVVRGIDEQILRIDEMVTNLDREWVNSDKILMYLRKNKGISGD